MAREPQIHYLDALYHVMQRGNGGEDIIFENSDRGHFTLAEWVVSDLRNLSNLIPGT